MRAARRSRWRERSAGVWQCRYCGLLLLAGSPEECETCEYHTCLRGLGDWLAYWLGRAGITQRRYLAWINWQRRLVGLPEVEHCNCDKRRRALNRWSNAVMDWLRQWD